MKMNFSTFCFSIMLGCSWAKYLSDQTLKNSNFPYAKDSHFTDEAAYKIAVRTILYNQISLPPSVIPLETQTTVRQFIADHPDHVLTSCFSEYKDKGKRNYETLDLKPIVQQADKEKKNYLFFHRENEEHRGWILPLETARDFLNENSKIQKNLGLPYIPLHVSQNNASNLAYAAANCEKTVLSFGMLVKTPGEGVYFIIRHENAHHLNTIKNIIPNEEPVNQDSPSKDAPISFRDIIPFSHLLFPLAPAVSQREEFFCDSVATVYSKNSQGAFITLGREACSSEKSITFVSVKKTLRLFKEEAKDYSISDSHPPHFIRLKAIYQQNPKK